MNRGKSSGGVEMEGYVAWILEGKPFTNPPTCPWPATARPLVIPQETIAQRGVDEAVHVGIAGLINSLLTVSKETCVVPGNLKAVDLNSARYSHLRSYRSWTVKADPTLNRKQGDYAWLDPIPKELVDSFTGDDRGWCGFEVCSPALWATDEGISEIRQVCQILTENLWVLAPGNTGLHVHYGNGPDWMPVESVRRIAGLLYAADPLLVQLQPQHRRNNIWCLSTSLYSALATGLSAETAEERLGTALDAPLPLVVQEDVPWWWFVTSLFRKVSDRWVAGGRDRDKADPDTRGFGRRGALGTYANNDAKFVSPDPHLDVLSSPLAIPKAVRELLKCRHPQVVAELMSTGKHRPAYSFSAYRDGRYGIVGNKRTVEFRQATGTFDADEVCAWTRVCFRLCEWAAAAELPEYWKLVLDCASAKADGAWYDVFDLIVADLGLLAEARVLKRIAYKRQGLEPKGELD
ncbi:hypothetical protein DL767_010217 [Monosporascus sp. MG133]|nr:hypothetical protein DL767_010217 [Monosporascus sp. MG133]